MSEGAEMRSRTVRIQQDIGLSDRRPNVRSRVSYLRQESRGHEAHEYHDEDPEDDLQDFDKYGSTPPRTRIRQRSKDKRKQRDREIANSSLKPLPKVSMAKLNRRNTICHVFSEMLAKADVGEEMVAKRTDKRSLKLLRGSERDLKLDLSSIRSKSLAVDGHEEEEIPSTPQAIQVETCNRFMSLVSKPVYAEKKTLPEKTEPTTEFPQSRVDFYNTFSSQLRIGCNTEKLAQERNSRINMSREEHMWQNELKDLIWLELQAWHAGRTPTEQDAYLCEARESIGGLLEEIMKYHFYRHKNETANSAGSTDSGVFGESIRPEDQNQGCRSCFGCLSMYCDTCMYAQNEALREVEYMMGRLEAAEALYPSSHAFAEQYPVYKCEKFSGKVKAMCLWYNLTKHHRLKLIILGRMLTLADNKVYKWPTLTTSRATSGIFSDSCSVASKFDYVRGTSIDSSKSGSNQLVQFDVTDESATPSDSTNSNVSTSSNHDVLDCSSGKIDFYNVEQLATLNEEKNSSPYRDYIEGVLKTKGLSKSLKFLESLHEAVLRKAQIALEKPNSSLTELENVSDDCDLRRYGFWSPEAQEVSLPSYRSAFLFLSLVPVEVIYEFLRIRLEQKPEKPSVLCVRQLMRELKEGIKIATLQRERVLFHFKTAIYENEPNLSRYDTLMEMFEKSLFQVLELYVDYLEQWALLQHENFQKSLLEEEWVFVLEVCPQIPGGYSLVGRRFCKILSQMLEGIGERLVSQVQEFSSTLKPVEENCTKMSMLSICRELQAFFNEEREKSIKTISFSKNLYKDMWHGPHFANCKDIVMESLCGLKVAIITFKVELIKAVEKVQDMLDLQHLSDLDEAELAILSSRCRETLHQLYRFGFELHKEIQFFSIHQMREKLSMSMIHFARLWMKFVEERCERGRGLKPRWANQGLDFLLTVCDPSNTIFLAEAEFDDLRRCMERCICHVIGSETPATTPDVYPCSPRLSLDLPRGSAKSRGSSSPRASYRTAGRPHRKDSNGRPDVVEPFDYYRKSDSLPRENGTAKALKDVKLASRAERVRDAINKLEVSLEERLREQELIGSVTDTQSQDMIHIRYRCVTFSWQRGIKIGQGRFGKVYTCVNNDSGEMMAMKEISLQQNDHRAIRRLAEELKILEGIQHENLVRYYGIEIHREEMLIFMEFCAEGTLESLVAGTENGLSEFLVRKYTYQLLCGVLELHHHGIVHRDIKSANIFLTDEGNSLKIGDFGSAVKIKAHTTLPGELQGFVGTQAYMAPEMFTKTNAEGHGRAADIWSVGCVVIEMASGKRPWSEYDSNYQVMFKVGMGETPAVPDTLSEEGFDFIYNCIQHDPRDRATAAKLLDHNFVKVGEL